MLTKEHQYMPLDTNNIVWHWVSNTTIQWIIGVLFFPLVGAAWVLYNKFTEHRKEKPDNKPIDSASPPTINIITNGAPPPSQAPEPLPFFVPDMPPNFVGR